ncbi:hypothetical protein CGZ80_21155 [Rhodopirellula sp. MGV]|nr:hypothetical protein CGZ80_21155 [Rhodopirellula sp. MGV]PNY36325.1 hypothetical protein C2E31_13630 [Rhodopirellula baltica]PNY37715.1 hypothetical protein C2E31_06140 [Rhodopirellula baltica]
MKATDSSDQVKPMRITTVKLAGFATTDPRCDDEPHDLRWKVSDTMSLAPTMPLSIRPRSPDTSHPRKYPSNFSARKASGITAGR